MYKFRTVLMVPGKPGFIETKLAGLDPADQDELGVSDIDEIAEEIYEIPASEWGTLCHRVLENIDLRESKDQISDVVNAVLDSEGLNGEMILPEKLKLKSDPNLNLGGRLEKIVTDTMNLDVMRNVKDAIDIKKEFRLIGKTRSSDQVLHGTLDLLVQFVDAENIQSKVDHYKMQLALYAELVSGRYSIPLENIESHIVFLDPATDAVVDLTEHDFSLISRTLSDLNKSAESVEYATQPSEQNCRWCDYHDICSFADLAN